MFMSSHDSCRFSMTTCAISYPESRLLPTAILRHMLPCWIRDYVGQHMNRLPLSCTAHVQDSRYALHICIETRVKFGIRHDSRWGGDAAPPSPPSSPPTPASGSPEGMAAAPPPEGWDLRGGMPAALEGASDNCPELALVELTPEAFLLSNKHNCWAQAQISNRTWLSRCCSCWWCSISAKCHNTYVSPRLGMHALKNMEPLLGACFGVRDAGYPKQFVHRDRVDSWRS